MSRSKRRPKPKMPGDGCWLCDSWARIVKWRKKRDALKNAAEKEPGRG